MCEEVQEIINQYVSRLTIIISLDLFRVAFYIRFVMQLLHARYVIHASNTNTECYYNITAYIIMYHSVYSQRQIYYSILCGQNDLKNKCSILCW